MALTNVYVLELTGGNYYVGSTVDINNRYQQHLTGAGAAWTRKYPPICIINQFCNVDPLEETNITKKYMMTYGIDKVRGGAYSTVVLKPEELAIITKEIWSAQGRCLRCGRDTHYINDCYASSTIDGNKLVKCSRNINNKSVCDRCGRDTHSANICKNKTHVDGRRLDGKENNKCERCGRSNHITAKCYATTNIDGTVLAESIKEESLCTMT